MSLSECIQSRKYNSEKDLRHSFALHRLAIVRKPQTLQNQQIQRPLYNLSFEILLKSSVEVHRFSSDCLSWRCCMSFEVPRGNYKRAGTGVQVLKGVGACPRIRRGRAHGACMVSARREEEAMSIHIVDDEQRSDRRATPMRPPGSGLEGASASLALLTMCTDIACVALPCICPFQARNAAPFNSRTGS